MDERSLADRVGILEQKVDALEKLPAKVDSLTKEFVQFRTETREGISTLQEEVHVLHRISMERMDRLHGTAMGRMDELHRTAMVQMRRIHSSTVRIVRSLHKELVARIAARGTRTRKKPRRKT